MNRWIAFLPALTIFALLIWIFLNSGAVAQLYRERMKQPGYRSARLHNTVDAAPGPWP